MFADRARLAALLDDEARLFSELHPESERLWRAAYPHLAEGVPMLWMLKWPGGWPIHVASASGAHITDVDGIDYVDLCLGDTGAMSGHAMPESVAALTAQLGRGSTFMLPTADAATASRLLAERFGLPRWQFTLSATDANRHVLRYARAVTGRPKVLVIDHCYHGTVDEAYATLDADGAVVPRRGNIGPPVPLDATTVVVPFNDVPALERALRTIEVAAVLIEPALTNIGIVLPDDGWHDALRDLCDETGTLLVIDETHTLCAGPGGMTARDGLQPDAVVVGKTIAGGVPAGAWGMSTAFADLVHTFLDPEGEGMEDIDVGGVGGTLAANALSMAGIAATLGEVLTPEVFPGMIDRATEWTSGVQGVLDEFRMPWQVTQLGCRGEYSFRPTAPHDGREAAEADDFELQQFLHLFALNRGVLMTPFHNMALMSPATTSADVDRHTTMFRDAVVALVG